MSRRILILNVVLLALLGALGWQLRMRWLAAKAHRQAIVAQQIRPKPVLAPPIAPPQKPYAPSDYVQVAQNTLFSKDRNPNVVIEPPKPAPEPPPPPLPHYHGQMNFGEPIALLSYGTSTQRGYHVGDKVGDYTLVSFDDKSIALEWRGKTVEKKLTELYVKDVPPPVAATPQSTAGVSANANAASAAKSASVAAAAPITALGGGASAPKSAAGSTSMTSATTSTGGTVPAGPGADIGGGMKDCVPGDNSPTGTVVSGFKKNSFTMMFGNICRWEPVQ